MAGTDALSPIAAGQSYTGLTVALNQNKFGASSQTITFYPTDSSVSGYSAPLDPVTLNISYMLEAPTMTYSQASGDVHIITYNNLQYDFQAVGEFVLAQSNITGDDFDIQLRLVPYRASSSGHGTQFLTGSQSEYAGLRTVGSSTYRPDLTPEGIAFYAPAGSFST